MEAEALPVIDGLGLTRDDPPAVPPPAPCVSFSGAVGDRFFLQGATAVPTVKLMGLA